MSSMNAVLISTNKKSVPIHFSNKELKKLKINLIRKCFLNRDREYLTRTIENYYENNLIFILSDQNEIVFESISKIFDTKLVISKHLAFLYKIKATNKKNVEKILLPENSEIFQIQNHMNGFNLILIKFKNIFILPNDLDSLQTIYQNLMPNLFFPKNNNLSKTFVLKCTQNGVSQLNFDKFADNVSVMRYCTVKSDSSCLLSINFSSLDVRNLVKCTNLLKSTVSQEDVMTETIDSTFWDRMHLLSNEYYVEKAIQILKCAFTEYHSQDIFLSFNGGKDCTVLLYLTTYVLNLVKPESKDPLLCVYIKPTEPFEEVERFIEECRVFYNFDLITITNNDRDGLKDLLEAKPNLVACLMGTRRSDPNVKDMTHFAMTDSDWPSLMRVNPILDWTYTHIWSLLLTCKIPYCELYDRGYTSVGAKNNTGPNPALKLIKNGIVTYLPAYTLKDESLERVSRNLKSPKKIN